jgi:hypothetical protein
MSAFDPKRTSSLLFRCTAQPAQQGDNYDVRSGHGCKRRWYLRPMIDYLVD